MGNKHLSLQTFVGVAGLSCDGGRLVLCLMLSFSVDVGVFLSAVCECFLSGLFTDSLPTFPVKLHALCSWYYLVI